MGVFGKEFKRYSTENGGTIVVSEMPSIDERTRQSSVAYHLFRADVPIGRAGENVVWTYAGRAKNIEELDRKLNTYGIGSHKTVQ